MSNMQKIVQLPNASIALNRLQDLSMQRYVALSIPILLFLGLALYGPESIALNDQDR